MIAALGMYDLPEVRAETDRLWISIRDALRAAGFDAPDALERGDGEPWPVWRDPELVLSQTCGLPFAARLQGDVSLLGSPIYDIAGCPPGAYRSEIVVRADDADTDTDTDTDTEGFRGRRFAFNMRESQSGWAAFAATFGDPHALFSELLETGGHRLSIVAVAEGKADIAAIDAVTWALALRHEPAARQLRVLSSTPPTPGLPYITARRSAEEASRMADAVSGGIDALDAKTKDALLLKGFRRWTEADYAPLAAGWPEGYAP